MERPSLRRLKTGEIMCARVLSPLHSQDASGSFGGITYSNTSSGASAKRKPNPGDKMDVTRPRIRSILGWVSRIWATLTTLQMESWDEWAANHPQPDVFGNPFIMSGDNAHMQLNHTAVRLWGAGSENALPPEDPPVSSLDTFTAATGITNPGDCDLTWTELGTGIAADAWEIQIAGPFQSVGRRAVISRFRYQVKVAGNVLLATIADLNEGQWYWFRCRYVALDGQTTAWLYQQATPMLTP